MLQINYRRAVIKFLKQLPPKHERQIVKKIAALRVNPLPHDSKELKGTSYRRADIGEYHIIYFVKDNVLSILLVGKRNDSDVYKKLKRLG